jgi:hypothetical protein
MSGALPTIVLFFSKPEGLNMPTTLTTLTQEFVDALTLPVGKVDMFRFDSDEALRGFAIRVRLDRRGRVVKKYVVCYKNEDGSQRRRIIGSAHRMSATAARLKARAWLQKAADGNDPAGMKDKNKKADAFRFERAVQLYLELKETKLSVSSHRHCRREEIGGLRWSVCLTVTLRHTPTERQPRASPDR